MLAPDCSGLGRLSPSTSTELLSTLCAALDNQCLNLSEAITEARQSDSPADGLLQQRNALLQYVFFIDWALTQGEDVQAEAVEAAAGEQAPSLVLDLTPDLAPSFAFKMYVTIHRGGEDACPGQSMPTRPVHELPEMSERGAGN